jgi:hypothetical protein
LTPPPTPLTLDLADAVRLALDRHPSIQSARDGLMTRLGMW